MSTRCTAQRGVYLCFCFLLTSSNSIHCLDNDDCTCLLLPLLFRINLLDVNIAIHHIIDMLCDTNQIALSVNQDWHYLHCSCSHFWIHVAQVPDCPHSPLIFSEPFLRFTLDFLVLIRKSSEKNWAWWLLQSKTWHFIECCNSPSYRLKDKWTGIKIFQGELQQKGTCRLTFGSAHVMLSMFSKVQIDISLGTTISKPHKEKKYFWALPESVPSPKFSNWALISNVFLVWSPTITMSFVTFDIDWQFLYQSDSSNVS